MTPRPLFGAVRSPGTPFVGGPPTPGGLPIPPIPGGGAGFGIPPPPPLPNIGAGAGAGAGAAGFGAGAAGFGAEKDGAGAGAGAAGFGAEKDGAGAAAGAGAGAAGPVGLGRWEVAGLVAPLGAAGAGVSTGIGATDTGGDANGNEEGSIGLGAGGIIGTGVGPGAAAGTGALCFSCPPSLGLTGLKPNESDFLATDTGALTGFTPGIVADLFRPPGKGAASLLVFGGSTLGITGLKGAEAGTGIFGPKLTDGIGSVTGIFFGGLIFPFMIFFTAPWPELLTAAKLDDSTEDDDLDS